MQSSGTQGGVKYVSERDITRIASQCRPHLARDIPVSDTGIGIRKAQRTTGTRGAVRTSAAEAPGRGRLHEAERKLNALRFHTLVVEAPCRRNRGCGQQVQRLLAQSQVRSASGKDAVRVRDTSRGANGAS